MARVTVEDCAEVVQNRFELVAIASQRAKAISSGAEITVERDNDKNAVVALREIAEGTIDPQALKDLLVRNYQSNVVNQTEENVLIADEEPSDEIKEELQSLQNDASAADSDNLLYGGDDVAVED